MLAKRRPLVLPANGCTAREVPSTTSSSHRGKSRRDSASKLPQGVLASVVVVVVDAGMRSSCGAGLGIEVGAGLGIDVGAAYKEATVQATV